MLVPITNTPRDYAWGSRTAIAELLGRAPSGAPEAELWLGAHPGSPARLVGRDGTLAEIVHGRLPFLLKVLAAASPLSLQAHPTTAQAEAGYAREDAEGIPLDAPERDYRDRFPKPEIIYALSERFRALSGFRPVAETRALLEPLADDPRIVDLLGRLRDDADLEPTVAWLLAGGEAVDDLVSALVEASAVDDDLSWAVVRRLSETSPGDPGIAISLLLHAVDLRPGEVLYLAAGNIHAYVDGVGVELMSASDNVLRGGLTSKHVDAEELLRVLDFRPLPTPYLAPEVVAQGYRVFHPAGIEDFALTVLDGSALAAGVDLPLAGPAILLAIGGAVSVEGADASAEIPAGGALFADGERRLALRGSGTLFVATVGSAER